MLIAALFITAKISKQSKCLSTGEQINNMWHIHIIKYNSAMKQTDRLV